MLETIRFGMLGSGTLSVEVSLYGEGSSPPATPANQDMMVKYRDGANRLLYSVIVGLLLLVQSSSRAKNKLLSTFQRMYSVHWNKL